MYSRNGLRELMSIVSLFFFYFPFFFLCACQVIELLEALPRVVVL